MSQSSSTPKTGTAATAVAPAPATVDVAPERFLVNDESQSTNGLPLLAIRQIVAEVLHELGSPSLKFATIKTASKRYDRTPKAIERLIEKCIIPTGSIDGRVQIDVERTDELFRKGANF